MINFNTTNDKTVADRLKSLKGLNTFKRPNLVRFGKIYSYETMPEINPIDNQVCFFDDGIEAIIESVEILNKVKSNQNTHTYNCIIVDDAKERVIEYSFDGRDYKLT